MPEQSDLDRRLRAVERALTDGEHDVTALEDAAEIVDRLDALEDRIDDLEERTAELDAATEAVRGYVGNVRSVNEEIEDRADAALAAVDRIEARLDDLDGRTGGGPTTAEPGDGMARSSDPRAASPRAAGDGRGSNATHATRNGHPAPATGSGDRNEFGIEMQASTANSAGPDPTGNDDTEDRTVIDRVREAL